MKHILEIHLEYKIDVIREIEIPSKKSLKDLHFEIVKSLELNSKEMAAFYITNDQFELLEEIPLFKIDDENKTTHDMSEITIESAFPSINTELIYIYDFLKMWRFLVCYSKKSHKICKEIKIINTVGKMPNNAPEINFEANNSEDILNDTERNIDNIHDSEY